MKKLLVILAVAGVFAACNSKSSGDAEKKDTTATSTMSTTPTTDTTHAATVDTTAKMSADTTKKK